MKWPLQSPDLNPIENAWWILKLRLRSRLKYPRSTSELFNTCQEEWMEILDSYFATLASFMPTRVNLVKLNRSKSTKYWNIAWKIEFLIKFDALLWGFNWYHKDFRQIFFYFGKLSFFYGDALTINYLLDRLIVLTEILLMPKLQQRILSLDLYNMSNQFIAHVAWLFFTVMSPPCLPQRHQSCLL